jgi:hypothetical protein
MKINLPHVSYIMISFACGFAACLFLVSRPQPTVPPPQIRATDAVLAFTQLWRPTIYVTSTTPNTLMLSPVQADPTLPSTLPGQQGRFMDLIETSPK